MAVQTTNVYRCTAVLKSASQTGAHAAEIVVCAQNAAGAQAVVAAVFGSDLNFIRGPVLAMQGVYTTMTGSLLDAPLDHQRGEHVAHAKN
jgi:hypothetical protein